MKLKAMCWRVYYYLFTDKFNDFGNDGTSLWGVLFKIPYNDE